MGWADRIQPSQAKTSARQEARKARSYICGVSDSLQWARKIERLVPTHLCARKMRVFARTFGGRVGPRMRIGSLARCSLALDAKSGCSCSRAWLGLCLATLNELECCTIFCLLHCSHAMVRGPADFGLVLTRRNRVKCRSFFLTADRHGAMIASPAPTAGYGRTGRHKLEDGRPLPSRNGRD